MANDNWAIFGSENQAKDFVKNHIDPGVNARYDELYADFKIRLWSAIENGGNALLKLGQSGKKFADLLRKEHLPNGECICEFINNADSKQDRDQLICLKCGATSEKLNSG